MPNSAITNVILSGAVYCMLDEVKLKTIGKPTVNTLESLSVQRNRKKRKGHRSSQKKVYLIIAYILISIPNVQYGDRYQLK